jgi:membrane associated rhomboid family serine protease
LSARGATGSPAFAQGDHSRGNFDNAGGNINHSAHLWGALFGLLYVLMAGKLLGNHDAVSGFVEGVKLYFRAKGLV